MVTSQRRANRKASGGRYTTSDRSKRKKELNRYPANTKIAESTKSKTIRACGGTLKHKLLATSAVNVVDKKGKSSKTVILNVVENAANPHLVRRNILTKGAIIETKLGKAQISNRPGQEGCINAVLL
mgnify:CR=1 FL=1